MSHDDYAIPNYLADVALQVRQWIDLQRYDRVEISNPYHDRGAICASFALNGGLFFEPTTYSIEAVPGEFRLQTSGGRYGHGGSLNHALQNLGYGKPYNPWGQRPSVEDIARAMADHERRMTP